MRSMNHMLVAAVLFIALTAEASAAQKTFEKKFTVSPGGILTVGTDVGSVKVIGNSSNEVSVSAVIKGHEKDVERFEVSASQSGDRIEVTGKLPKGGGSWFWNSTDLDVEFTVSVPREFSLRMNTSGGNIAVSDLKGEVRGETSGGNIEINGIEGSVDLETSGGNMRAEKCTGKIHLETSGGNIAITTITGELDVSTSGGNVKVSDVEGQVRAETSGGDVVVKMKGTNKGVYAETSGGSIDIVVPKSIAANIDAATSGGEVRCDLPVTLSGRISEDSVKGTLNGGGNVIHAHTSGGDVRIRAAD